MYLLFLCTVTTEDKYKINSKNEEEGRSVYSELEENDFASFFEQLEEYPTATAPETIPSQESPPEAAPSQESPPEAAPSQKSPPEAAPSQESPPEAAPSQESPPEAAPLQESPPEAAPSQESPQEATPLKKTTEKSKRRRKRPDMCLYDALWSLCPQKRHCK